MLSISLKRLQTLFDDKKIRLFTIILLTISILVIVKSINTITDNRSLAFQYNNLEAENSAQISGKYNIGEDQSASGGKYIQLGIEGQSVTNTPSTIPTNTVSPTRAPTSAPTTKPLSTYVDPSQACPSGQFVGNNIPPNGNYKATAFGCVSGWKDPNDNCIPECGSPPECGGLSGRSCEEKIAWFSADRDRYGCFSRLKVTNPKTGKAAVVMVLDRGPSCAAEQSANGPIFDMSYTAAKYVGGSSGGNYETVHVEKVSKNTPLGPISGSSTIQTPVPTKKPTTVPTKSPTSIPTQKPSSGSRPYFGMAVDTSQISNYSNHIKKYGVNIIAPANSMKMQTIGGCNGSYNFTKADQILNFAKQNNMQMHGHTLVWYSQTSSCATSFSKTQLKNYIQDVMKHYCGKLYSMDVVNEALADGGGYRTNNVWYRLYSGPGYIEDSFKWAREACPSMKLYYNDYSIETYGQAKTTSMLNLVRDLKAKNLLDGVGFQAHWTRTFDRSSWSRTMDEVSKMGLEFAISEMDVRFEKNYWDLTQNELNLQATTYRNAAELCRDKSACHHMIVWGVHDGDSWVNSFKGVADAALLFTRELRPKPAYCNGVKPVFNLPNGDCN